MNSLADIADDLEPAIGLTVGKRAPAFSIETLDDVTVELADLRDRVLLLNFWGTWCGPCRREMPEFQKAYEEWNGARLRDSRDRLQRYGSGDGLLSR